SRADDRADTQRGERPGTKRFLQPVLGRFGISQELVDAFNPEELRSHAHRRAINQKRVAKLYPEPPRGATVMPTVRASCSRCRTCRVRNLLSPRKVGVALHELFRAVIREADGEPAVVVL